MKKVISLLAVLVLVVGCVSMPAYAAKISPEVDDVISDVVVEDANGDKVVVELIRVDELDEDLKPDSKDEKVIAQYEVKVEGDPEYPLTFTVDVAGVKKGTKVYILAKDEDGSVQYIEVEVIANGKIRFKLDKYYSIISLISDVKTSSNVGTSDKTGDIALPSAMALLMISGAAIAISKKKIEE